MTTLITGGAGFIGSHLVDYLLATTEDSIRVLDDFSAGVESNLAHIDSPRLSVVTGDVCDENVVMNAMSDVDRVFHLAAAVGVRRVIDEPLDSFRTNLVGTENVLEAAAAQGSVPVFIASSSEVYGKSDSIPFSESDDRVLGPTSVPRWSYATAKAADEFLGLSYHKKRDLPVVVGRFFNIVGPRQSGEYGMVIPTFVEQALDGQPITVYGDGTQSRSFTHVFEAVKAISDLTTAAESGKVFNVGSPNSTSINELAERVVALTGSDSPIEYVAFEEVYGDDFNEPDKREPDVTKLREAIGWAPKTNIDRILQDVVAEKRDGKEVFRGE